MVHSMLQRTSWEAARGDCKLEIPGRLVCSFRPQGHFRLHPKFAMLYTPIQFLDMYIDDLE